MTELLFGNELVKKYYSLTGRSIDGSRIEFLITDYEENSIDPCVEAIDYYGKEHPEYSQGKSVTRNGNVFLTQCLVIYYPPGAVDSDDFYFGRNSTIEILKCGDQKVSGEFNFIGKEVGSGATINITEGVFTDIEY